MLTNSDTVTLLALLVTAGQGEDTPGKWTLKSLLMHGKLTEK